MKHTIRVTLTYDVEIEAPSQDDAMEGLNIPTPQWEIIEGYPTTWEVGEPQLISYDYEPLG